MTHRIGIIGPSQLTRRVVGVAADLAGIEAVGYPYESERQAAGLVSDHRSDVDGFLFTGVVPYRLAQASGRIPVPARFVPLNGASLYRVLTAATIEKRDVSRASIDTLMRVQVDEAYADLGIDAAGVMSIPDHDGVTTEDLVAFHRAARADAGADVAITCLHSAYEQLSGDIAAFWLIPAIPSIRLALQAITDDVERHDRGFAQVAIALVEVPPGMEDVATQLISDEAARLGGTALSLGPGLTMIMTTRGAVESATGGFLSAPVVKLGLASGVSLWVGYGVGRSAREAEHHAGQALARARSVGDAAAAVCLDGDGPRLLAGTVPIRRAQSLAQLARQTGVSESQIRGLIRVAQERSDGVITAVDVAHSFGITPRSGRRIIERLERLGLAREVDQQREGKVGRPRSIYRLEF